jgi:cytochrome c oxidase subunit 2
VLSAAVCGAGCVSDQSILHPAGTQAQEIARLFWIMTGAGAVIWAVVIGLAVFATLFRGRAPSEAFAERFILLGGMVIPSILLGVLLVIGLRLLPGHAGAAPDLRVHVTAEQFWWRVAYDQPGRRIESANELHLPAGAEVEVVLTSPDVIHSFWIPTIGGKMDAIPGRTNVLRLSPTVPGRYRGVCAEFCGLSHALMAFDVEVHGPAEFAARLEREALPARGDPAPFLRAGCAACHAVRGLVAGGSVGPDLTHLALRRTIGAGTLPLSPETLRAFVRSPEAVKPGARMPGYAMLPEAEIDAIVAFLMGLS